MKKLIILLVITIVVSSCENKNKPIIEKVFYARLGNYDNEFKIIVIDTCEYLYTDGGNNGQTVFHKGNCKYCTERNNR